MLCKMERFSAEGGGGMWWLYDLDQKSCKGVLVRAGCPARCAQPTCPLATCPWLMEPSLGTPGITGGHSWGARQARYSVTEVPPDPEDPEALGGQT